MWVSIGIVPCGDEAIYLPEPMTDRFKRKINVSFGKRTVAARVETSKDMEITEGRVFEEPQEIRISSRLASKLLLAGSLTYQMKFNDENIVMGPVIGLLLGDRSHVYNPRHMEKYSDRFGVYSKVGGLIYAFSPKAIDWEKHLVYGLFYNNKKSVWQYGMFPIPSAIYRRYFHSDHRIIRRLMEVTRGRMFNSWRFTKSYLYQYISRDGDLSRYLPQTELASDYGQMKKFIDQHNNIILKPTSLSRGRGICIIRKAGDTYRVLDYRTEEPLETEFEGDECLVSFFQQNQQFFENYVIQKHLSLAQVEDSLFDIRVVMQKERPGEWKCTGIECRVAAPGSLLTNISRGGYALTIDEALRRAFPDRDKDNGRIKQELDELCHKLCKSLDGMGHHFGELGLDIAIDKDMKLWIIEANVFPSFKGFKEMDYRTYLDIRHTPIKYAAHLAGFRVDTDLRGDDSE